MKFDGITIVSDMDGTLLDDKKQISENNMRKIDYFRENGGNFTIASGRLYNKITMYAEQLSLNIPIIASNGAVIYDFSNKKVLYLRTMDKKCLDTASKIHERFPTMGLEVASVDHIHFIYNNPSTMKHIKDENFFSDYKDGIIKWEKLEDVNDPITKVMFCDSSEQIDFISEILPKLYEDYTFVKSDTIYYEMLKSGTSKGIAIPKLAEILGKKSRKIYTIGDNMNDYEMLQNSDFGVCVKNGNEELKKISDFIIPYTNNEDAVCHLIDMIEKGLI